jgi:hypothetical protein
LQSLLTHVLRANIIPLGEIQVLVLGTGLVHLARVVGRIPSHIFDELRA